MRAMPMQRAPTIVAWIGASLLLAPATLVADMAGRVALSEAVVAHKESITLSDFLPPDAPEKLRARPMELKLGEAPLPGARRTFIRAQMEWRLRGAPEWRDAIAIPTSIEVSRWSRALTHEEVLVAIEDAMRSNQLAVPVPLLPQDLVFRSNVSVTEAAPKLKVTRIESSSDGAETHVRLSTPSEPHSPAFWVTLLQ